MKTLTRNGLAIHIPKNNRNPSITAINTSKMISSANIPPSPGNGKRKPVKKEIHKS